MNEKYCRFRHQNETHWGLVEDDQIILLVGNVPGEFELINEKVLVESAELLPPVAPSKIVCVGLNYAEHVKESQSADEAPTEPVLFLKPPTSLLAPEAAIVRPQQASRVDYEAEIGVVLGKTLHRASAEEVAEAIFGVTCVNDVTARDLQKKDTQWTRAKGFDTFCPVGPYVVTSLDYLKLKVESRLNGEVRQSSDASFMLFPIPELISFMSQVMTLNVGDLIVTGTPKGIGPMVAGDVIEIEVEGVGTLRNNVADQA
jgi:2-keto-4-pentenoate hydratase/2-oxohepta-3-ene-1,7-dioic acid hydratase in catechol pathway